MKVWVITVEHRHGSDTWVRKSENGAISSLAAYVSEWWSETGQSDMPTDAAEAIEKYFALVSDEFYSLEQFEVQP